MCVFIPPGKYSQVPLSHDGSAHAVNGRVARNARQQWTGSWGATQQDRYLKASRVTTAGSAPTSRALYTTSLQIMHLAKDP